MSKFVDFKNIALQPLYKQEFKLHPPPGIEINPYRSEDEPIIPQTLKEIGMDYILNNVEVAADHLNPSKLIVSMTWWLTEQLNYNQRYMLMCNYCWALNNLIGEATTTALSYIKTSFSEITARLMQLEGYPGDFGQSVDFRKAILPSDFGLEEYE